MILADKIIQLRKKAGWSQEELAEQLQVSRQSVSKWESAQSVPDLERILQMSWESRNMRMTRIRRICGGSPWRVLTNTCL